MKILKGVGVAFVVVLVIVVISLASSSFGWLNTWFSNKVNYINQRIDDATNYETIKRVENTCRSMIASYQADKITYEQYKESDNAEKQSWAEQAKMRANRTAASYNEYILSNSFIWRENVPDDIFEQLLYLE